MTTGPQVLFCADPLRPNRVDDHFAGQADLVRSLGGRVALIDHDALLAGDAGRAVRSVPDGSGPWWYRGWMIPSGRYAHLAEALGRNGIRLRVEPRRYRLAHEFPGWFASFVPVTPDSNWMAWTPQVAPTERDVAILAAPLESGPAIVKDYVKSRKHEWDEACFIPDLANLGHTTAVVARMVELQGEMLNGGIVLRRFEPYRQVDGRAVEARAWWVDGVPVMVTAHPDAPLVEAQPDLSAIAPLVAALGCPFVTTDLAQLASTGGGWRVVEVGDGQVSDLPAGVDPTPLFERLAEPSTIDAAPPCPQCGEPGTPILFGLPVEEAHAAADRGELVLRGCLVPDDYPHWACARGHEWVTSEAHWLAAINLVLDDLESGPTGR